MPTSFIAELTDLYCGEANYSWVRRAIIEMPDWPSLPGGTDTREPPTYNSTLMRRAKRALRINGTPGRTTHQADGTIEFRPYGRTKILFIFLQEH